MKKYFLAALLILPAALFAAAQTEPMEERIIEKENGQIYYNFPSANVPSQKVEFVLPQAYNKSTSTNFPVVYVLGGAPENFLPKDAIFVFTETLDLTLDPKDIAIFINNELAVHTDLNYRTISETKSRLLAAQGTATTVAAQIFPLMKKFDNISLSKTEVASLPKKPKGKVWLSGKKENISKIKSLLTADYVYGQNLLYSFSEEADIAGSPADLIFSRSNFLTDNKFKLISSSDIEAAPFAYDGPINITLNLKFKSGLEIGYLAKKSDLTFNRKDETPLLLWDEKQQAFFINQKYPQKPQKKVVLKVNFEVFGRKDKITLKIY